MIKTSRKILLALLAVAAGAAGAQERAGTRPGVGAAQEVEKEMPAKTGFEEGPVSVRLGRGGRVAVDNRTTGRIVVIGWDRDFVEARATSERGTEAVRYTVGGGPSETRVWLKADYSKRQESAPPTGAPAPEPTPSPRPRPEASPATPGTAPPPTEPARPAADASPKISSPSGLSLIWPKQLRIPGDWGIGWQDDPPLREGRPVEVHLEVRVPRYAEIEVIRVIRSPVEVTGVEMPLIVVGSRGDVVLKDVGAVEVRTRDGKVDVENARGFVDVVTTSGPVRVRRAGADVRALSISGDVSIECVRGRVNVDSASGPVRIADVQGDVDASASNGDVFFSGAIREDGRYNLKSMSGSVEMALRPDPAGFTAALSSYRGAIENDFQLKVRQSSHQQGDVNRRVVGSYGGGQAQISLDTFDGKVKLGRAGAAGQCFK